MKDKIYRYAMYLCHVLNSGLSAGDASLFVGVVVILFILVLMSQILLFVMSLMFGSAFDLVIADYRLYILCFLGVLSYYILFRIRKEYSKKKSILGYENYPVKGADWAQLIFFSIGVILASVLVLAATSK